MTTGALYLKNPSWMFARFCRDIEIDLAFINLDIVADEILEEAFELDCEADRENLEDRMIERDLYAAPKRHIPGNTLDLQRTRWQEEPYEDRGKRLTSWERSAQRCVKAKKRLSRILLEAHRIDARQAEDMRLWEKDVEDFAASFEKIFSDSLLHDDADAVNDVHVLGETYAEEIILGLWDYAKDNGCVPTGIEHTLIDDVWCGVYEITQWLKNGGVWLSSDELMEDVEESSEPVYAPSVMDDVEDDAYDDMFV